MRYQGSEAYSMETPVRRRERPELEERPSFEVVSGGGLDASARRGVSAQFVSRLRAIALAAAVLIVLGAARVTLAAATVSLLQDNVSTKTQISEAQSLNDELKIERAVLSSNSRISRIATQNYGMVLPGEHVTISLDDAHDDTSSGQASSADGEAAQTMSEPSSQSGLALD